MAKKIAAIFAALILSASILASCAGNNTNETTTTTTANINANDTNNNTGENSGENNTEETPETTTEAKLLPNLEEDTDFGKYEFKMLTKFFASGGYTNWMPQDVVAEEENGDSINDATYKRNRYLEDKYNFVIKQVTSDNNMQNDVRKSVNSGDKYFDAAEPGLRETPAMAQSGFCVNLKRVNNLDLSQPWWDQGANTQMSVNNKLFFTSGNLMVLNYDACSGILFNKKLLGQLGLQNPYELVLNNNWTIDSLYDLCKNVSADLNGDGQINDWKTDRYGFVCERDGMMAFYHGVGERTVTKDASDIPQITFGTERCYAALEGVFKIMYDQQITINVHHYEKEIEGDDLKIDMFQNDRDLFLWTRLGFVRLLREMETEFGILPMPKLDSNQEKYYGSVNSFVGNGLIIPNNQTDDELDRTGFILEAICAESKYTTVPAYYDVTLKTKLARDVESSGMLDIIFENMTWDLGDYYDWGGMFALIADSSMTNDRNIASKFEKKQVQMEKAIANSLAKLDRFD